nr:hypothetical protein [Tanacetum cinerariifolium]
MDVCSKFGEFLENKESVEEVVVGGGKARGDDDDESNRLISVLKDGGGVFDDNLDEINLCLSEEFVIRLLEGRDVSARVCGRQKRKKSVSCDNERRDCTFFGASVFTLFNLGPDCFAHRHKIYTFSTIVPFSILKLIRGGVGASVLADKLFKSLIVTVLIPLIMGKVLWGYVKGTTDIVDSNHKLFVAFGSIFHNGSDSSHCALMFKFHLESRFFIVGGYQWAVYVYPYGKNQDDNSTYVSLFIALVSEGSDVRALFELTMVNQSGNERHKVHSHFDRSLESGPYTLKYRGSMRYVLWKPSRDFTRPFRPPSGLKGLLHMLNAIVTPTKGMLDESSSLAFLIQCTEQFLGESLVLILLLFFIFHFLNVG